MRSVLFFCLTAIGILPLVQAQKHPFTFEDMMALKRVEEPEVSPDGKWVLFAAVDVDLKANTKTPHVWVVSLDGAKAGSSTSQDHSRANDPVPVGMTASKEREIISDQDADRPRWAPDGKRFAFVSKKENGSQIWIADFDSATGTVTGKRRLTNIATEASGELWSPDGKNILFKSDVYPECDGTPESEAECNAKKLDEKKNSKVKAQVFTHLLYRHWNAYKEGKRTHLFLQALPNTGDVTRNAAGQELIRIQGAQPFPAIPLDLTPGDYDAPVFSLGGQDDYAFSPDGKEICYASNHDPEPAISTNNDLFTVPVNVNSGSGGTGVSPVQATPAQILAATKDITADNKAADNTPLYSPDGKYIAYRAQARPGYESDRWRLMLYDRKTGEQRNLTENWDHSAGSFGWAGVHELNLNRKIGEPQNWHFSEVHDLTLTADDEGESPIYSVAPEACPKGCYPIKILDGFNDEIAAGELKTTTEFKVTTSDIRVFSRMSVQAPAEIFTVKYGDDVIGDAKLVAMFRGESREPLRKSAMFKPRQLTHINDSVLSQVSMSPLESFWFPGAHNDKVQGFLVKPPNFDPNKKYPVKFIIHGGPEVPMGDEWSYRWNFELFAANGYVVIFINFHGSPGYGQKFIDAINGDWGGAPFEDLMKGLDYAEQHYPFIDKDRECALGASYGGYMANWILGHTNRFKCIVTHDGMFNTESAWGDTEELWFNEWEFKGTPYTNRVLYSKWSPHLFATNFKTPTLVIHSQLDYRLDVSQGFDLFTTLQREGVPSKMLYFPDEGHWVLKPQNSQLWYKTVDDWVDQWVGNRRPVVSDH
jgi:dipeptidyl aminopeptidase/acylaminoacyl peptidase